MGFVPFYGLIGFLLLQHLDEGWPQPRPDMKQERWPISWWTALTPLGQDAVLVVLLFGYGLRTLLAKPYGLLNVEPSGGLHGPDTCIDSRGPGWLGGRPNFATKSAPPPKTVMRAMPAEVTVRMPSPKA